MHITVHNPMTTTEDTLHYQAFLDDLAQQAVCLAHWAAHDYRLGVLSEEALYSILNVLSWSYGAHVSLDFLPPLEHNRLAFRLVPSLGARLVVTSQKRKRDEDLEALKNMFTELNES